MKYKMQWILEGIVEGISDWFIFTGPNIVLVDIDFLIFKGHTDGVLYRNCRWEDWWDNIHNSNIILSAIPQIIRCSGAGYFWTSTKWYTCCYQTSCKPRPIFCQILTDNWILSLALAVWHQPKYQARHRTCQHDENKKKIKFLRKGDDGTSCLSDSSPRAYCYWIKKIKSQHWISKENDKHSTVSTTNCIIQKDFFQFGILAFVDPPYVTLIYLCENNL